MRDAGEVNVDLVERCRAADEADRAVVGKIGLQVCVAVGRIGHLAVAAQVEAAQDHVAALAVDEPGTVDCDPPVCHQQV